MGGFEDVLGFDNQRAYEAFIKANSGGSASPNAQPLTILSRGVTMLGNGFSANSAATIFVSDIIFNPQDSKFYAPYGDAVSFGLARSISPDGPWTDLGYPSGLPSAATIQQHRVILGPDNKWSWYVSTGTSITLYQTAAAGAITSAYSLTGTMISSTVSTWDAARVSEMFVFKDQGGTWRMLFMAEDNPPTGEQIGVATSSGDHTGPWTKYAGNPIIAKGGAGTIDGSVCGDPWCVYYNGVYYIGYAAITQNQFSGGIVTGDAVGGTALVTTTDWVTFTKRGSIYPTGLQGSPDSCHCINGAPWWPGKVAGDNSQVLPTSATVLCHPYFIRNTSAGNPSPLTYAALTKTDPQAFFTGAILNNPWKMVGAASGDAKITESGTWGTNAADSTYLRGVTFASGYRFSNTASSTHTFSWTGTRARLVTGFSTAYGITNITLDGVLVKALDAYQASESAKVSFQFAYDTGELPPGPHSIVLTNTGTKNASSTGTFTVLDRWDYI